MSLGKVAPILTLVALVVLGGYVMFRGDRTDGSVPTVAITQIATHPALDEVRAGIISGLAERGYQDGTTVRIVFRNANGDASLTVPIAEDFLRISPDVIVPISTPSAISVATSTNTVPIVFSGVTDPVGTGLVDSLDGSGTNITGVSDRWPFEAQVQTFIDVFPDTKVLGMLFTQGDDVSRIGVDAVAELASQLDFELRTYPVSAAQDVYPVAVAALRDVDAIYTGIDHLLLENMDGLVKAANEARKPLYGGESGSVEKGAVLAVSINMTDFGKLTSELVVQVLQGTHPGEIPVRVVDSGTLLVNEEAAKRFGLDVDQLVANGAQLIQ